MTTELLPLTLLSVADEQSVKGITRLQKLIFLVEQELLNEDDYYKFRAGQYGPFSRGLYDDIDDLVESRFIDEEIERTPVGERKTYTLTEKGQRAVTNALQHDEVGFDPKELAKKIESYEGEGLRDLLKYVYSKYPEMARNSKLDIEPGTAQ